MSMRHIVYAADQNYAVYMAVSMCSVLRNSGLSGVRFHVLSNLISQETKSKIKRLCEWFGSDVLFYEIGFERYRQLPQGGSHISNTTYCRYEIADHLPRVDRALYLDCDTICAGSLADVFDMPLGDEYFAAVEDVGFRVLNGLFPQYKSSRDVHFNAGVLMLNLSKWREDDLGRRLYAYTTSRKSELTLADQEVLNEVCRNRIASLPCKYNVQAAFFVEEVGKALSATCRDEVLKACKEPKIVHYTSREKPWTCFSVPLANRWLDAYLQVYDATGLGDARMTASIREFMSPGAAAAFFRIIRYAYYRIRSVWSYRYRLKANGLFGR